jgi:uncharacterized protein (UPF0276 family)
VSAAALPSLDRPVGIGLRQPHYAELLDGPRQVQPLGFVEVHSENFFADGGAAMAVLHAARARWDVSLHGVGLSLGSACGLDPWHLDRLARLAERIEPVRVSDHASFARAPGGPAGAAAGAALLHANDLLPLAFTREALDVMISNVTQVQERLRRPILVENLSAYLAWQDQEMSEPEFFNQLTRRTGCGLLLDVNNLVVNGLNRARDGHADAVREACDWIDAIDAASVGEIHLAGYLELPDIVVDDHGSRVHEPVWRVFAHAVERLGPRPTLVEWDTELPALAVLLEEAAHAERVIAGAGTR